MRVFHQHHKLPHDVGELGSWHISLTLKIKNYLIIVTMEFLILNANEKADYNVNSGFI